ncbi:MerR family transcriptional regulator [Paractinoplanes atraurantiacus]|uniref:DNA-binding transcriptional regulator, MerR family n=1 Tax=Paractinoplanes atraurantiacus TaxID=1036182 RepID=A0A285KLN4_9ACTN|nr:MerR family transcriptional regulator [Actinoplanes atraurantiacus]SNY73515.1 DNA-binding transcriptional regulator, MerR family [Actinoplanes atraurantiacus]
MANGLTVGEVADRVGLTVHTLRWYEQEGLVDPVERDTAGHRRYSEADLGWLDLLIRLRTTGMPVRDMRRYADMVRAGDDTVGDRLRLFVEHKERVLARIAELQADLAVLDAKIAIYGELAERRSSLSR